MWYHSWERRATSCQTEFMDNVFPTSFSIWLSIWQQLNEILNQDYRCVGLKLPILPQQFLVTSLYTSLPVIEKIEGAGNLTFFIITQKLWVLNINYVLSCRGEKNNQKLFETLPSYNSFVHLTWKQVFCFPNIFCDFEMCNHFTSERRRAYTDHPQRIRVPLNGKQIPLQSWTAQRPHFFLESFMCGTTEYPARLTILVYVRASPDSTSDEK